MKEEWLKVFGKMTYGIYVLTSAYKNVINGMIASWVSQVSYSPPLIMVAVHPNRYTHEIIKKGGSFALHLVDSRNRDFLKRFKGEDPEGKFEGLSWSKGDTGSPVIHECPAYVECRVQSELRPGNHALFLGEVVGAGVAFEARPMCTQDYEGVYVGKD